ncbi:hypothetical protein SEVIR_3G356466v4 [Setaria viridis]
MGEQPECKLSELWTPNIDNLLILNIAKVEGSFEINTSINDMVQHNAFTSKKDANICRPSYTYATPSNWTASMTISYVQDSFRTFCWARHFNGLHSASING